MDKIGSNIIRMAEPKVIRTSTGSSIQGAAGGQNARCAQRYTVSRKIGRFQIFLSAWILNGRGSEILN